MGFFSFIFVSSFTFFYFVIYFFVVFHCFYDDDDDDGNDDDDDDDDEQASKNCHENVSFLMSCPSLSPFNNVFSQISTDECISTKVSLMQMSFTKMSLTKHR